MSTIPAITERTTCRVCNSPDLTPLFSFGDQLVNNFVTEADVKNGFKDCPRCPLDLELCNNCRLVQLHHTAPQELLYSRKYWYKSGMTATMRTALRDVAESAVKCVTLKKGDVIIDIGSNDGTLLRQFERMDLLSLNLVGVEPADNLATEDNYRGLELIHDFWSWEAYRRWLSNYLRGEEIVYEEGEIEDADVQRAKIITALGMFYDMEDPIPFIQDIAKALHPDGVFIAQLMCLRQTVDSLDVGNFCHEHLEYYSLHSLHYMLEQAGLGIFDIETNNVNGGSYRLYITHRAANGKTPANINVREGAEERVVRAYAAEYGLTDPSTLQTMYQRMLNNAQAVKTFILKEVRAGKKVFVYGASTKGNSICQWMGLDHTLIEGAADKDSDKWGRFTMTGIPIMSEQAARAFSPDYFLILPYSFKMEMIEREKDQAWRKRGGKFIVPIPELEIL